MDRDLVTRAQQGDERAFETLALASYARLHKVAHGILRDRHLAEDAAQQALLDIWRYLDRLRDPSRFEGWSYRVLVNVCHAEAKRRPITLPDAPSGSLPVAVADIAHGVADRDQLERGFRRLSVDHRAVIVLHYLMDLTLEQVAETLELPVGTVNSRLSRASAALRAALEADARPAAPGRASAEASR